jgi:hypothetical protein
LGFGYAGIYVVPVGGAYPVLTFDAFLRGFIAFDFPLSSVSDDVMTFVLLLLGDVERCLTLETTI